MTALWVALGGAAGALGRYAVSGWAHALLGAGFPWGTVVVNVSGSFLLGALLGWMEGLAVSAALRAGLTIGLLGAFTTFSTFTYEAVALLRDGQWAEALAYVLASVGLGLAAIVAGFALATVAGARGAS